MRVLMLTSSYPLPQDPSWGPFVQTVARAVAIQGCSVRVLTFSPDRKEHMHQENGRLDVCAYPYSRILPPRLHCHQGLVPSLRRSWIAKLQFPAYLLASSRALTKHIEEFKPDLIHAHWYLPAGWIASHARSSKHIPIVTTAWGAEFYLPRRWPIISFLRRVDRISTATVAVSQHMRQLARNYGLAIDKMQVIPNGVDTDRFEPNGRELDANRPFVVGTARRLVPEKRVEDILLAVSSLPPPIRERIEVQIAGDGPERSRLKKLAETSGIGNRVRFLGMLSNSEMPAVYRNFSVFVNPSVQEGMATANLEAMACGVPVIAYIGSGNDEVIADKIDGRLVAATKIDALASAIREVATDESLRIRMARAARRRIEAEFSMTAVGTKYQEIYQSCIAK